MADRGTVQGVGLLVCVIAPSTKSDFFISFLSVQKLGKGGGERKNRRHVRETQREKRACWFV